MKRLFLLMMTLISSCNVIHDIDPESGPFPPPPRYDSTISEFYITPTSPPPPYNNGLEKNNYDRVVNRKLSKAISREMMTETSSPINDIIEVTKPIKKVPYTETESDMSEVLESDLEPAHSSNSTLDEPMEDDGMARLVYEIPNEMIKFKTYEIEVRIANEVTDQSVISNIEPTGNAVIRSSDVMQVELVDPSDTDFRIVSQSEQQLIEEDGYTTWIFYVTPLTYGEGYLSLIVSIIKDGNLKQSVYKDRITINTSVWIEAHGFITKYWQWAIGFISITLIPFFKNLYTRFKKKK